MISFGTLVSLYVAWLKQENRPSATRYQAIYRQFFLRPEWSERPADAITRHEVLYFKQTHSHAPAQCAKALGLIKQAYNWAADRIDPMTMQPYYTGTNPAWRIAKHESCSRERMMDRDEIRRVLTEVCHLDPMYHALFVTRLLTPCRIKELCAMRWDAVEWTTGKWFKRYTKNKRPQYVLIPRQAVALLLQLPRAGEFVFPGHYNRPLQPGSAAKAWAIFRKDSKLPKDLQLLDFRRTLASYLYTEIHADDLTAKAVLNHYDARPVAIYTRLNYDRLAGILQQYADWVWSLMQPVKPLPSSASFHLSLQREVRA